MNPVGYFTPDIRSHFSIHNLPFGIAKFKTSLSHDNISESIVRAVTAYGDYAIDLAALVEIGLLQDVAQNVFEQNSLNEFMKLGRKVWQSVRHQLQSILSNPNSPIWSSSSPQVFHALSQVEMLLPVQIGDYTDFYSSREHATNVGTMFRGKDNALQPNWLHLPVGYHGRASSVVVSGTPIIRPNGQIKQGVFGPSAKLDIELEMAFVVGVGNELGKPIAVSDFKEHVFGLVLMNDWSARDIQAWEYVPLGPFLGKNFGTTISPWIVTLDALEPFLTDNPVQNDPEPLPYLKQQEKGSYDVNLQVNLSGKDIKSPITICNSNLKYLYWTMQQQLAHHTINGCNMKTGDLCGSGTISGPTPNSMGSLLELTWNGSNPIRINGNEAERTFLQDGDTVTITGYCQGKDYLVGFGECAGTIYPALNI